MSVDVLSGSKIESEPEYPLAEQTAVASVCIRECVAYLHELGEVYARMIGAWVNNVNESVNVNDECRTVCYCIKRLTDAVASIVERLPVGKG